jgi:hypothetical protein
LIDLTGENDYPASRAKRRKARRNWMREIFHLTRQPM